MQTPLKKLQHWHGLAQAVSPWADGTPMVSQWPIPPHHFFDYRLVIPNDTFGTYFYHSHVGFQSSTASGALIIEDPGIPPYAYNDERTLMFQELFNYTDDQVETRITADPLVWFGETNGFLVNGDTISDYGVVDNATARLNTIEVEPGKMYRLRLVGATTLSYASFAFEGHGGLEIIEADGSYTTPVSVDVMQLGGGERYSVLLHTKTCDELRESGKLDFYMQLESRTRTYVVTNYALLRYHNSCGFPENATHRLSTTSYPAEKPLDLPPVINDFLNHKLEPLFPNDCPTADEVNRRVILNAQQTENGYYIWHDSNVSWSETPVGSQPYTTPTTPYLVALYNDQEAYLPDYDAAIASGGVDPKTKTFPAKIGEVLEIVIQNIGSISVHNQTPGALEAHPWHAHGGHFYDLGSGAGAWSADVMEAGLIGKNPVRRDTTMLFRYNETTQPNEKSGWRVWRLRVENAGVWMVHCHWLQHMIQGMQTVWVFGDAEHVLRVGRPEVEGYLAYGRDVVGRRS